MNTKSMGFIGGGRITGIILEALRKKNRLPETVVVSDVNAEVLNGLKEKFSQIEIVQGDNTKLAEMDIVFVSLHPPVMMENLAALKSGIKEDAIVVSLAPRLSIAKISELLGGFNKIVRMIPNAPTIVNQGYNPVVFGEGISEVEKKDLKELFAALGEAPEVEEAKLEGYAITVAMGSTYLWFQLYELQDIASGFGFTSEDLKEAITKMVDGTVKTMFESGLSPQEVMNLVPVKPLAAEEENIRNAYRINLEGLYKKLKQ